MIKEFNLHALKTAKRLPSPSGSALAIMQMVQKDDFTLQQLVEIVRVDPALTSRILSFANSASFGAHRPIANINEAMQLMGIQAVKNFALSLSLVGNNLEGQCVNFDYSTYWMEALAIAVAMAAITARERTIAADEAFSLGLLSEIGQLAMATAWPDIFGKCLSSAQGNELLSLERKNFTLDHNELTVLLMQDWGLPNLFIDALKLSFEPPTIEVSRTVRLASQLSFARQIAHYCIADNHYRASILPNLLQEAVLHHFSDEELSLFLAGIIQQWHVWGKLIDVNTDIPVSFQAVIAESSGKLPGLDILLVDDDPILLARLSKQLQAVGHQISVCGDGDSALKYVLEKKPQLVITDWRMKPMDGLTLCKTLRSCEIGKKLYVIMVTAAETEDELVEAFDAGVDDYVTKPVNLKILLARIRAGQRIATLQQELEKEKQDIQRFNAELTVANRRLSVMANTDSLTNLPNRRYAMVRLEQEWESAQRHHQPISVLMLDLDYFKSVNDTLGHDSGDMVLVHAAKLMKSTARTTDIVCRFGGEEFLVIASNTDGNSAKLLAERMRIAIQFNQPANIALPRPLTVSIGVSGTIDSEQSWKELIKMADRALYQVKANGRNATKLALF